MSLVDNVIKDIKGDATAAEGKLNTNKGRAVIKYSLYGFVLILLLLVGSCMVKGCFFNTPYQSVTQPQGEVVAPQPVVINNPDPMSGVIPGMAIGYMMSNGMRYDGHNGYHDRRYHGPPRTIIKKTVIVNKTVNVNKTINPTRSMYSSPIADRRASINANRAINRSSGFSSFSKSASVSKSRSSKR